MAKYEDPRFKFARIKAGLQQRDVARVCNVSEATVSRWETGRAVPPPDLRRKVGELLGKSPFEIFG